MKIITRCVIDIRSSLVIEEDSFEYSGPVVECKGGGGGGSGAVSYPAYMQDIHGDWLDNSGADAISSSITDIMNAATGNSPWTGQVAYDPDADLTVMTNSADDLQTLVDLLSSGTTLDTLIAGILDHTRVDLAVTEFAADLDARLVADVLPRFERGMQDINAVVSSAFVIGRALIEQNQDRQVAVYSAGLHMKAFSDDAIKVINLKLEYQKMATHALAEVNRIKIVAKKEETDTNIRIDEEDAKWDLEVFQYGSNVLASIGGGTAQTQKGPSTAQSVMGGAMAGAAAGTMVGGPGWGTVIGAVLGAASALM